MNFKLFYDDNFMWESYQENDWFLVEKLLRKYFLNRQKKILEDELFEAARI